MMTIPQILVLVFGLLLTFFGLFIYRSTVKVAGFVVGAAYGIYLCVFFLSQFTWDPLLLYLTAAFVVLILGVLGTYIAEFANVALFFLAGGLIGVVTGKLIMGIPPGEEEAFGAKGLVSLIRPQMSDLFWFVGGAILFVIALDTLVMLGLTLLGVGLIRWAIAPLELFKPDWVIPGAIGILGLMVQEAGRRRAKERLRIPKSAALRKIRKFK